MSDHPADEDLSPLRDRNRLAEIAALDLLHPDVEEILADVTEAAAERLGLPISLVSAVLGDAQQFAASHGLQGWLAEVKGTPLEWSFCANAVESGEPFVVDDATRHSLVQDNPLVRDGTIRCYAGVPLVTSRGFSLGTLCVIGPEARTFSTDDMAMLKDLAAEAIRRIESRRKSADPDAPSSEQEGTSGDASS